MSGRLCNLPFVNAIRKPRLDVVTPLNGLRGLAVAGVVLYHFFGTAMRGGYMGVDVFFVLSGFLITSQLIREVSVTKQINLKDFWVRRLRRIFPLAIFVAIISVLAATAVGGDVAVKLRSQFFGVLFFVNNWVQISQGHSYFDAQTLQVTTHYWSLAIEEQYYLLWPLIVLVLLRYANRGFLKGVTGALIVLSAVLMAALYRPGEDPSRVYFGTDTHAFGLLMGSYVAMMLTSPSDDYYSPSFGKQRSTVKNRLVMAAALVGLIALFFALPDTSALTYRGGLVLASLLASLVVIGSVRGKSLTGRLLSAKVPTWAGQRSYSIYLWHWPLIVLLRSMFPHSNKTLLGWIALIVVLLLSEASFRWIENPFRRHGYAATIKKMWGSKPRQHGLFVVIAMALVAATIASLVASPSKTQLERDLTEAAKQGPPPPPAPAAAPLITNHRVMPSGDQIIMEGDSVMLASKAQIEQTFPGVYVDAQVSRHYMMMLPSIQALKDQGALRQFVVVGGGTNGPFAGGGDTELANKFFDTIGPDRTIIYVLPYGDRWYMDEAQRDVLAEAQKHDNVYIADWCHAAKAHPDVLRGDGIHPTTDGAVLYTEAIRDALQQWVNHDKRIPEVCPA